MLCFQPGRKLALGSRVYAYAGCAVQSIRQRGWLCLVSGMTQAAAVVTGALVHARRGTRKCKHLRPRRYTGPMSRRQADQADLADPVKGPIWAVC